MKGTRQKGRDLGSFSSSGFIKPYRQHKADTETVLLSAYLEDTGAFRLPLRIRCNPEMFPERITRD